MSFKMKELLLLNKVILAYWTMMMYFWLHGGVSSIKFWFFNQLNFLQITWFLGKILSRLGSNGKLGKLPCESSRCRALQMVV